MRPVRRDEESTTGSQQVLDKSIEEGLRRVLGDSGLKMVLSIHPLGTISSDPARFHQAMKEIFMERGAAIIEAEIARRLLQNARREQGRGRRSWFGSQRRKPSRRVSADDKAVLRRFLTLAALNQGHLSGPALNDARLTGTVSSFELTSLRFADAFKKGS